MKRLLVPILLLCCFGLGFSTFDDTEGTCTGGGFDWMTGTIYGNFSDCCGDDGVSDLFYNSSVICYDGSLAVDTDLSKGFCEENGSVWMPHEPDYSEYSYYPNDAAPSNLDSKAIEIADFNNNGYFDSDSLSSNNDVAALFFNYIKVGSNFYDSGSSHDFTVDDFNEDDWLDIVISTAAGLTVLLNDGDGTFSSSTVSVSDYSYLAIDSGDFDGDGHLDLATHAESGAGLHQDQVHILLGNGDGTFEDPVGYDTETFSQPRDLVCTDLNGDGYFDVIAAYDYVIVGVFLNDGDGTFASAVEFSPYGSTGLTDEPSRVTGLEVSDIDNDGDFDLGITRSGSYGAKLDVFSVLFNDGNGAFSNQYNYTVGSTVTGNAYGVQIYTTSDFSFSDLNGDGWVDVIIPGNANLVDDNVVAIMYNDGSGGFTDLTKLSFTREGFVDVDVADLDDDGSKELFLVGNNDTDNLIVYYNDTGLNGTYGPCCGDDGVDDYFSNSTATCYYGVLDRDDSQSSCETDGYSWVSGVIHGNSTAQRCCGDDGSADDFYNGSISFTNTFCQDGVLVEQSIEDDETLCEAYGYDWVSGTTDGNYSSCCGDDTIINEYWDFFYNSSTLCYDGSLVVDGDLSKGFCEANGSDWFLVDGSFGSPDTYSVGDFKGITVGDFDGDGYLDLASTDYLDDEVKVNLNDGDGTFASAVAYSVGNNAVGVAAGDVDNDGDLDLVTNCYNSGIYVLLGNGDGTFASAVSYAISNDAAGVALGDVDGDGYLDIVSAQDGFSVLLNDGDGTFGSETNYVFASVEIYNNVILLDLDGDGDLDVAGTEYNTDSVVVKYNNGDGTFPSGAAFTIAVDNEPFFFDAGDLDNDGDLDLVVVDNGLGCISVLLNDGDGTFAGDVLYCNTFNSPYDVGVDDVNADGYLDIVVTSSSSDSPYPCQINVLLNDGDGTFADSVNYVMRDDDPGSYKLLGLGDFDNDGYVDVAAGESESELLFIFLNDGLNGTYGPCCGDDSTDDDFYNLTTLCDDGSVTDDADLSEGFCEVKGYDWLSGTTTGSNDPCCGDDGATDDFYNATDGYGGFCNDGSYFFGEADNDEGACSLLGYDWLSGASGLNTKCCGDDGSADDFGNTTGSCCCNGVLVPDGTECDLDGDGNIDALCENGNLPDFFISDATDNETFVSSDYTTSYLVKNTGNETVCITSAEFTNTSLSYTADASNPECLEPGESGVFLYHFGGFDCDDLDLTFNPVFNMTYQQVASGDVDSLLRYISLRVTSPLDITSIIPAITDSLPVPVNEFNTFLLTIKNFGSNVVTFNASVSASSDVLFLFNTPERRYSEHEFENTQFTLLPNSAKVIEVKVVALTEGDKTATLSFSSTGACGNITDSFSFQLTGFKPDTAFFNVYEVSAWDWVSILLLMIAVSMIVYREVKVKRKP